MNQRSHTRSAAFNRLIEQARDWPRLMGEGVWFNEMADWMERAEDALRAIRDDTSFPERARAFAREALSDEEVAK